MKKLHVIIALLCAALTTAQANTITPFTAAFTPGVSIDYSAKFTSGELHPGDGFTIFDIGGFTGFGTVAAAWTASAAPLGSPYSPPMPGGADSGLMNVTFTYTGAPLEAFGATFFLPFEVLLSPFAASLTTDDWVSKDHLLGVPGVIDGGLSVGHADEILVPAVRVIPDSGATSMLLGVALSWLACLKRFAR